VPFLCAVAFTPPGRGRPDSRTPSQCVAVAHRRHQVPPKTFEHGKDGCGFSRTALDDRLGVNRVTKRQNAKTRVKKWERLAHTRYASLQWGFLAC
jgi:hypothetical protein